MWKEARPFLPSTLGTEAKNFLFADPGVTSLHREGALFRRGVAGEGLSTFPGQSKLLESAAVVTLQDYTKKQSGCSITGSILKPATLVLFGEK